jgi:hypothetical protein
MLWRRNPTSPDINGLLVACEVLRLARAWVGHER